MITTNHPLSEALKDIENFKLGLADYFKDKNVFPIKNKVELGSALPCGELEAGELVKFLNDSDFPIKNAEDLAMKLSKSCSIQ